MAAGPSSIQIRIDCMALVQSTAQFLSTPQQVATRPDIETPFFGDILDKPFFGPFSLGLWIAIVVVKTHTQGWDWSELLRIVVVGGVWGMSFVLHRKQHERSVQVRSRSASLGVHMHVLCSYSLSHMHVYALICY